MSHQTSFDIAILGGGMVGATLACALADSDLQVAIIDPKHVDQADFSGLFDLRVSAITRGSQRIFENLQVWPAMQKAGVSAFRHMQVWQQDGRGEMSFDCADLSESHLGHIIENRVIVASLYERLAKLENVTLLLGQRCHQLQLQDKQWQLQLDNGEYQTTLLVGADGSQSWLRQQRGIMTRGWDYDQAALVTYVKTALSHQETAWQRFLATGPLAFLPLKNGYSSIVWSTQPQQAQALQQMDETAFVERLAEAIEHKLGRVESVGPRAVYPLRFLMAERYIDQQLALVGDAAHTIHPLAGQGVNLGIFDAASLAQVIKTAKQQHQPFYSEKVLRSYERWRKSENMSMLVMVDQIQRLYSQEFGLVKWLRGLGMDMVNHLPLLKHQIIDVAMGNRGDLPHLAQ